MVYLEQCPAASKVNIAPSYRMVAMEVGLDRHSDADPETPVSGLQRKGDGRRAFRTMLFQPKVYCSKAASVSNQNG